MEKKSSEETKMQCRVWIRVSDKSFVQIPKNFQPISPAHFQTRISEYNK